MNYTEALDWVFHRLPMYQKVGKKAFNPGLANIQALAGHLGHPEKKFKSVHIGGTNGKGSTANMMASVFQEAGYKTGLYTSPHLRDFRERVRVNGNLIPKEKLVQFVETHRDFIEEQRCSFFELSVALAFDHFARERVDIAIIEVGLGGRLDATNILTPELSIITNIGLDHTHILGHTHSKIAAEKAGIIKPGIPVVIGEYSTETAPVFIEKAQSVEAPISFAPMLQPGVYSLDLLGGYQEKNAATVLKALTILSQNGWELTEKSIKDGLQNVQTNTNFIGRFSILGNAPKIIADTAHNAEGLKELFDQVNTMGFQELTIVLGIVKDKDTAQTLPLFPKNAKYFFCRPDVPRGMPAEDLCHIAEKYHLSGTVSSSVKMALNQAKTEASAKDLILVCGSTFTVAEII